MTTTESSASDGANHGPRGRFVVGNKASKGNKLAQRMSELRRLVENVTGDDLREVVGRLVTMAKGGDVQAAGLLLSYACGKPRPAPVVLELDLPPLTDAKAVAEALRAVTAAVAGGALDVEAGAAVVALVERVGTATCWQELERRVQDLEQKR